MTSEAKFMSDEISKKLLGSEIIVSLRTEDDESFGFRVRTRDKRIFDVWVDCDAEGNGCGWLAIQPKEAI